MRSTTECPASHRDATYGGDPALDRARLALTHRVLLAGRHPRSVFEIGFGSGALLRRFHASGADIGGVDPHHLGVQVDPVVQSVASLWHGTLEDVPVGAFMADLVVGVHVIEHMEDPLNALRTAVMFLNDGGRLVLLTPAGDSWGPRVFGSAWWMLEDPTHVRFFTEQSLRAAAHLAGLVNIEVDRLIVDSISVDVASTARVLSTPGPEGVLARPYVKAAAVASIPAVLGVRTLLPRSRATLRLTAERPAA